MTYTSVFAYIHASNKQKVWVYKHNASDEVNPIILIQFGSLVYYMQWDSHIMGSW